MFQILRTEIMLAENCLSMKIRTKTLNRKSQGLVNMTLKSTKVAKRYIGRYISKSN